MNICFINPTRKLRMGLIGLAKSLNKKKHKIFILTPTKVKNPIRGDNVKMLVYPSIFIPKIRYTVPNFIQQYRIMSRLITKEKIDVIHCWSYFYPVIFVPLLLAKRKKIPFVLTIDSLPGKTWFYGQKRIDFIAKLYTKFIGSRILRQADFVVGLYRNLLPPLDEMNVRKRKVIPNGIDLEKFRRISGLKKLRKELCPLGHTLIINISRMVPVKGIEHLIEITRKLCTIDKKIKVLIVGDGPYKKRYEKLAKGTTITFTGYRSDITEILSVSDIFLLTSVSEGLPNVVLEAMACEVPVIAGNVGGISDIINSKNGFLINLLDTEGYVKGVEYLIRNREAREKMVSSGLKTIKERFACKKIAAEYERLYESISPARR